jgi:antitoxin MazE
VNARVQKWGNSLAVRIPKSFAQQAGLAENAPAALSVVEGKLLIEPVASRTFTLDELLAGVTETNIHAEIPSGSATGQEAW